MKNYIYSKIIFFLFLLIIQQNVFSLEYVDTFTKFSDAFSSFVDDNEGSTSFPSLNIPSGGREESLGSALTALCDDISFFEYNPAASCILKNTEFAFFHNAWIADSNLDSFAGTWRKNDLGMGFKLKCFYVPFTEYNAFGDKIASNYYSETTGIFNISYNFFHGYYFKGLSVGANAKASWRSIPNYSDKETGTLIKNSGLSQSALGFMIDTGVLVRFNAAKFFYDRNPNLNIGLSILNAGFALTGFKSANGITLDDALPTSISLGISYRFIKPALITLDFNQPINLQDFSRTQKWSCGIGLDVNITNSIELMAGFRLKGANPRISLGTQFDVKKFTVDFNYTFDLTSSINPVNHFSIGARVNLGDRGRYSKEIKAEKHYKQGLIYYANGQMSEAVKSWEECLKLNPAFTPAKNNINLVKNSQNLFDRVINIQNLE